VIGTLSVGPNIVKLLLGDDRMQWWRRFSIFMMTVAGKYSLVRVLEVLAAIITIIGIPVYFFRLAKETDAIVLAICLSIMVFVLWGALIVRERQARFAQAVAALHDALHQVRDTYYSIVVGDTHETVMSQLRGALSSFATSFSILTGTTCRACIKQVFCEGKPKEQDLHSIRVTTFSRFPQKNEPRDKKFDEDMISDNTDYLTLFVQPDCNRFHSNNLLKEKGYHNSHWTQDAINAGRVDYQSTIVWPIRKNLEAENHDTWGFLCIDSMQTHVFVIDYDFPVGAAFADALYILLKEMDRQMSKEEES
jgi:hypothetical protein